VSLRPLLELNEHDGHACATAAAHDRYFVTDGGDRIVDVWGRVNGW
jgi:D-serine deaminase-like pyridoxal phosphate-dependent protein